MSAAADIVLAPAAHHARLSASGLERARACPAAYALPVIQSAELPATDDDDGAEDESADATRGTLVHAFLERVMRGESRETALAALYREAKPAVLDGAAAVCEGINLASLPRGEPEVAFAYDAARGTARRLPRVSHRDYGDLGPTEIPGTVDLVVPPANNRGVWMAADFKTGFLPVTPAAENLQLAFAALCVAATEGVDEVEVAIIKFGPDGSHSVDAHRLDLFELEDRRQELAAVLAAVTAARESGQGRVREGAWCRYCAARNACPVVGRAANELATVDDAWLTRLAAELETDAGAARWHAFRAKAAHYLAEGDKAFRARVARAPVRLPDGQTVRLVPTARTKIDGKVALPVLRQVSPEFADACCKVTVTAAAIREAAGEDAERVLAALDAAGAVVRFTQPTLRTTKG